MGGAGQKAEGCSETGWPCRAEAQDAGRVVTRGESLQGPLRGTWDVKRGPSTRAVLGMERGRQV